MTTLTAAGTDAAGSLQDLEGWILARGSIRAQDVVELRRAIYRGGSIGRPAAETLLRLHRRSRASDPSWDAFYVEALTDFFFWGRGDDSVLGEDDARLLAAWLGEDGRVEDPVELRLLLSLMFRSHGCPAELRGLAMRSVLHSVLACSKSVFAKGARRPGLIDEDDVEMVRRLVYGSAGESGLGISRQEAEFLFELNNRTRAEENTPSWQPLFVKAITMYLLHGDESAEQVDDAEAQWLMAQIDTDRADNGNERALLAYLRQEATALSPVLAPLFARFGL